MVAATYTDGNEEHTVRSSVITLNIQSVYTVTGGSTQLEGKFASADQDTATWSLQKDGQDIVPTKVELKLEEGTVPT